MAENNGKKYNILRIFSGGLEIILSCALFIIFQMFSKEHMRFNVMFLHV